MPPPYARPAAESSGSGRSSVRSRERPACCGNRSDRPQRRIPDRSPTVPRRLRAGCHLVFAARAMTIAPLQPNHPRGFVMSKIRSVLFLAFPQVGEQDLLAPFELFRALAWDMGQRGEALDV